MSAPYGGSDDSAQGVAPVESNQQESAQQDNPEWQQVWDSFAEDPVLANFVPKIQERLKPHLSRFETEREQAVQQYKPYEELAKNNVPVDYINNSMRLYQVMDQNPRYIFDALRQQYNFTVEEAKAATQQIMDQNEEDPANEDVDPRIAALQQEQDRLRQAYEQDKQSEAERRQAQQLDGDISKVLDDHKKGPLANIPLDVGTLIGLINQELFAAEQTGKYYEPNLVNTYQRWAQQVNNLRAIPALNQAPRLTPTGGGGLPVNPGGDKLSPEVKSGPKSTRVAAILERMGQR